MEAIDIINIIQKHSLTVRCLPHIVVSRWNYKEGDEKNLKENQTIEYSTKYNRKVIREERKANNGGWWYVKETKNISSNVQFSREYDKFFAPTLEEAINLFLKSLVD